MKGCVFCDIEKDKEEIVFEDRDFISFLDNLPIFKGHTLLVPKVHYETIFDVPDELLEKMSLVLKKLSIAVKGGLGCDGILIINNNIISQSVPHLHVHIVPRKKGEILKGFMWPRHKYDSVGEMETYARSIRKELEKTGSSR